VPIFYEELYSNDKETTYRIDYELSPCDNSNLDIVDKDEFDSNKNLDGVIFIKLPQTVGLRNGLPFMDSPKIFSDTVKVSNDMANFGGNVVVVWPHGAHIYLKQSLDIKPVKMVGNPNMSKITDIPQKQAHPNPANKFIKVSEAGEGENASVFDSHGNKVKTVDVDSEGNIDIDSLAPGIYYVIVVLKSGKTITVKIIKEK